VIVVVLAGFAVALAAPWIHRAGRDGARWVLALLPLALFVYFAAAIPAVAAGEALVSVQRWIAPLGIELAVRVDGLALLFALLITGVGCLVVVYAGTYLNGHPQLGRFYAYLLLFMASMLGLVVADDVITLFVFWELTSLASYLLIGFDHERPAARAAALQALLVTGGGGLALLAGLVLLGGVGGSLRVSELAALGDAVRAHELYLPILILVLAGAFTKSAQLPFHFWLPSAMEAPTPVSAYLHSATMVKAGIYLMARLAPVLGGTAVWTGTLTVFGAATMVVAAYLAFTHTELKRVLAYTTVSALGVLTMLLGVGGSLATTAAVVFLLGHALYKGALFLIAGIIDHETGVRDTERLGGLWRAMPVTGAAALAAAASLVGMPPLFGFLGKEMLYEATLLTPGASALAGGAVLAMVFGGAAGVGVGVRPFLGSRRPTPKKPHEAPAGLWLGPVVLAGLGLVLGLVPLPLAGGLIAPAVSAVLGGPAEVQLKLWHGFTLALGLSAATLGGVAAAYAGRGVLRGVAARLDPSAALGPARLYEVGLAALGAVAAAQTRFLQNGYLRSYLFTVLSAMVLVTGYTFLRALDAMPAAVLGPVTIYEVGLAVLLLVSALAAVVSTSRFGAVAALGVMGFAIALVFLLFGAVDLAITQVLVDTLTIILFVVVFFHLPRFGRFASEPARPHYFVVAVGAGAVVTALLLAAIHVPSPAEVSAYFLEHSVPLAHGRNVVNVILVDFRALDTLGEITVLALAGAGVYALVRLGRRPRRGD
jgi:multicomponent Na+:H+ antiporter subunit A